MRHVLDLQEFYYNKGDIYHIRQMDDQFHEMVCRFSRHTVISDVLTPLHRKTMRYRRAAIDQHKSTREVLNEHRAIFDALAAHDAELAQLPGAMGDSDTKILIGPENVSDALKDTSVVMASYDIGEGMRGVIGVVGPTRMDYAKVTARLNYFAESLSKMFGKGEPEQLPGRKSAPALQPPKPDSDSKE